MLNSIEKKLILIKMIHIKEQKNGINYINDTKLFYLDLIKQSSLTFQSCLS